MRIQDLYDGKVDYLIIKNATEDTIEELGQLQKQDLHGTFKVPVGANNEERVALRQEDHLMWHNDRMYFKDVHPFVGLYCREAEEGSSGTMFCDMKRAWASLPQDLQEKVKAEGEVEFSLRNYFDRARYPYDLEKSSHARLLRLKSKCMNTIYRSDKFGEYAFFSPVYTSSEYLDELSELLFKPEFCFTHQWEAGDLVVWNNLTLSHRRDGTPRNVRRNLVRYAFDKKPVESDYITHLDLNYSKGQLNKQSATFDYKPFEVKRAPEGNWFRKAETWLYTELKDFDGPIREVANQVEKLFGTDYRLYIFNQEAGTDVPVHKDLSPCAVIIQLSDTHGPITFEEFGDIDYEAALVNTQKDHLVKPHPTHRIILKFCMKKDYETCLQAMTSK